MIRKAHKPLLILAALAAALATAVAAPAAHADCISDATVTYVGANWGPIPLWRVSIPALHETIDVAANSADEALALVAPGITCPADPEASPPAGGTNDQPPAGDPPLGTDPPAAGDPPAQTGDGTSTGQAQNLLADATVTYVGNSWGPVPVWRVFVPARNVTYDVAAANADAARAAVLAVLAADIDRNPNVAPAASSPALAASQQGTPVQVDTSAVTPFGGQTPVTPAKAASSARGVHHAPATGRMRAV